ncbi:MAG: peptidylprolyl isomerase [Candidatus Margulisbacteria bacterium]|nr:peptidylprolyl isomerase [Candidatus Margulisiibacteriota bacterium]
MLSWLRKKTKTIMIVVAVVFAGSMFYGIGFKGLGGDFGGSNNPNVIAKVNGREVTAIRYREILNRVATEYGKNKELTPTDLAMIESLALGQAIDFTMLVGEARKKVRVSGREIDATIDNIMKQQKVSSKRDLEKALKAMGLDLGKFKDLIRDDILVQKLNTKLQEQVRLTPDDLREIRASHILVPTEAEAKELLSKLKAGGDFAQLAKQYSKDTGSAKKGGDLGYFTTGMMVEPFEQTVLSLKPGQVSGIVKTQFGYHIIKVTDSRIRNISEEQALQEKKAKTFQRWHAEVAGKAKVEVLNPVLKGHDYRFKGMLQPAITEYKKGLQQEPNNPMIYLYLGELYLSAGRKDLAIAEYENAVKIEGGNPELYIVLGKAYEQAGESELASAQFRKASLVAGDSKELHEKLLAMFQKLKKGREVAQEKAELQRIQRKLEFEKELQGGK